MFETSVIRAEVVGERRVRMVTLSFAFHGLVVIAIFAASIRSIDFPTSSPREYAIPIFALPPTIPPPLGTPNGGHKQATPVPAKEKAPAATANMAPNKLPEHVTPAASTTPSDATTNSDSTGSDQPKGVPWGTKDSIGDGPPATNTAPATPDVPIPVTGDVKAPVVIHRVSPLYPRLALSAHMNGTVVVECIIDKTGRIRDARVLTSSSPMFNQSAIEAVEQWQFAPGTLYGNKIDTIFDLTVTFKVTM
ncbi:MAG TPA: TonB family protein [Thermoanaerobaculia bacterium]|nr:TonB family protein [Thermoanaerobaculia bacterium]